MTTPTLTAAATLLAADLDTRELEYLILPYGEPGSTNMGKVTASAGAIELPTDPRAITFNMEHDFTKPVGRGKTLVEATDGLRARFGVVKSSAGDDLLIEAAEGLRTGASVEIDNPVIRAGALVGGRLTAVAAVVRPAFPSAQLVAADCGDLPTTTQEDTTMAEPQAQPAAPAATTPAAPAAPADTTPAAPALAATDTQAQPAAPAAPAEPATAAPAASTNVGLTAARQPITPTQLRPATPASKFEAALKTGPNFDEFCALLASKFSVTSAPSTLLAALSEIASTDAQDVASLGQWAGEMWAGKGYERKYVPLLTQRTLTSLKVKGWEFDVVPEVGDYAGIGNEPASQAVAASETSATAARLAGGWALDRSYADFSTPEFWAAFWRQAAKSYAKKSDAKVTPALVAATGAATDLGAAPSGVATAAHLIVEGAMSIIDDADPSFALVATPLYKELLKTRADDSLAYIRMALGIKDGDTMGVQIVPDASLNDNEVLVGDKNAAAFYELPGVPVRVDTASIANGSVEHGLFGYYLIDVENTAGLALVSDTEPE